jgi:hypothetical protein
VLAVERKEVTISPKVLAEHVRSYHVAPSFALDVTLEGTQLMTQGTGQGKSLQIQTLSYS